jgi:predicted site-specific integrase-resolvase
MMPALTNELLPFSETAQRLGVDVQTVRRWMRTEQCPIVHDSRGRVRVPAAWVADPKGWML